jgi:hypothetical protein
VQRLEFADMILTLAESDRADHDHMIRQAQDWLAERMEELR